MTKDKVPYSRKPSDLSLEEWQVQLRKQYAVDQHFKIKNIGKHPFFSDFEVHNPESGKTYKVSIRDNIKSFHFCTCPDFTINGLGTCKHIEYLLLHFEKYKKYRKYFNAKQQNSYSSLSVFYGLERKVRLKKADSVTFFNAEKELFDEDGFLYPDKVSSLGNFIQQAKINDPGFTVYPDIFELIEQNREAEDRQRKIVEIFSRGLDSEIFQEILHTRLYPYQKEGIMRILKAGRVLLADDMGLGKTVQTIAAIELFHRYFSVNKILIVCPTSLKYQWKSEMLKFTGRDAAIVEGLIHSRKKLYADPDLIKIISYGACRNDTELIRSWNPDLVILDEAQRIKNWKTQTAQAVKKINSGYAIVLTGTPLENRIDEIHSIVEYIDRYRLGPLFRFLDQHQVTDKNGKLSGYKNLRNINKSLEGILIRRTKKEIADQLPARMDKNFYVEMTEEQMTDHNSYYDLVSKLVNKWIHTGHLTDEERQKLLINLNCMRMVCDSTYILNQHTNYGHKIAEVTALIEELTENPGNKVVVFSQWKRMFELVIRELQKRGIAYEYLNGDLSASERKTIIDRFTEDPDTKVFLSTDAGGVGVNLQTANILINIDLPWNPAVLEQRIGRIFRLGQKKHINVFNFIAKGSIEHRILYLLDFKRTVFTGVIEEEGKDEVMLEGFMDSVRALTEIDTESYIKNSFQQQPFTVNEKESVRRKNEETSENPETSAAADSIKTASTCVKNSYPSGSLISRLGGFLKKLAAKILNRK
ncbi:MAG: DEAD/DEAH box helicase [Spirochaetes bacterium]|nr:DEAD/DEAH box helicase [Spirochaetota bacterium]